MAWTNEQKKVAIISCRYACIDDDHRALLLRQFPRAMHEGRVTSTSPHLTNADFEQFMAMVERQAGGQLPRYTKHYWRDKADDVLHRTRRLLQKYAIQIEARGILKLGGFIRSRITDGRTDRPEDLSAKELDITLKALRAIARRNGFELIE